MKVKSKLSAKDYDVVIKTAKKHFSHLRECGMLIEACEAKKPAMEIGGILLVISAGTNEESIAHTAMYNAIFSNVVAEEKIEEVVEEAIEEVVEEGVEEVVEEEKIEEVVEEDALWETLPEGTVDTGAKVIIKAKKGKKTAAKAFILRNEDSVVGVLNIVAAHKANYANIQFIGDLPSDIFEFEVITA